MVTPMVFDSLLCISQWMWDITICLKFKLKYGQGDSKVEKHTLACSFFNHWMLINGCHILGKPTKLLLQNHIFYFLVQKQHKINASGSKLYMNLKKNNFCICQKEKTIFTTTLLSNQMHPLPENSLGVTCSFWFMGYVYIIGFRFPGRKSDWFLYIKC